MSKLFKLKEWLTIPETARRLTISLDEEVREADVLRLALDGHLKLSINFVNHTQGRRGKFISLKDTQWKLVPKIQNANVKSGNAHFPPAKTVECPPHLLEKLSEIPEDEWGNYLPLPMSLHVDGERYIDIDDDVTTIKGIWDLSMIGAEQIDIEYQYQQITGGPEVTLQTMDGAFVERTDGTVFQLQTDFDDNEYQAGSTAQLEALRRRITNNNIEQAEAQKLLDKHKQDRKEFLERRASNHNANNYFPAGGLPEDGVLVVRTEALQCFEQSINDSQQSLDKPLLTTERNTLLTIIAALCDHTRINYKERGTAAQIARMTQKIGAPVSDDAIREALKKISNTLESSMK